ncbi:hypothetical protein V8E51_017545 [Hyaloscypha variabilis]
MADEYPDISATLRYLVNHPKYATEKPYRLVEVPPTSEVPSTNMEFVTHSNIQIKDIRKQQHNTNIETHGFRLYEIPSKISMDSDYKEIELYCRSMADFVKAELGALEVFVFEFRFRSNEESFVPLPATVAQAKKIEGRPAEIFSARPVWIAHLDQTQEGGLSRIRRHLTEEESKLYLSGRYRVRVVNIWRTFNTTAHDMPLAFCNPKTISQEDLIAIDLVGSDKAGESYYLFHSDKHEWYWASNMKPLEAMVFSTWDSEATQQSIRCAFHTAFPSPYKETSPRLSIEVRTIVVNGPVMNNEKMR